MIDLKKDWQDIVVILFFVIAVFVRVNVDGIYLNNPGNVKAADPVFHTLLADGIAETGVMETQPPHMVLNHKDGINTNPPQIPVIVGAIEALTGLEPWNLYYLMVCMLSAFAIPVLYLLIKHLFSKEIALLASGLLILPLKFGSWFYLLYIGIWPNSTVFTFLLLVLLFAFLYIKSKKDIYLILIGFSNAAVLQIHFSELFLIVPVNLYLIFLVLKDKKDLVRKFFQLAFLGLVPFLLLMATLDHYVSSYNVSSATSFGLNTAVDIPAHIPGLGAIGLIYGILILYALFQLGLNFKKYFLFLGYISFLFVFLYILPYFLSAPYYISLRPRYFMIFFIAGLVAYSVRYLLIIAEKIIKGSLNFELPKTVTYAAIFIVVLAFSALAWADYSALVKQVSYQNLPEVRYKAYAWVQENTPEDATFIYFAPGGQKVQKFMKRLEFNIDFNKLSETLAGHNATVLPLVYPGYWETAGSTSGNVEYRAGFLDLRNYPPDNSPKNILDFDYIYFENQNEQLTQLNMALAQYLMSNYNFVPVYNDFAIILKNGNR